MVEIRCVDCGTVPGPEIVNECPLCGGELYTTRLREELGDEARIVASGGATTFFQPGLMVRSILEESDGEEPAGNATDVAAAGPAPPPLRTDFQPFFLILGAPPGEERIDLLTARTTFGRADADVDLGDATVSARHFQVDVMGAELFLRDLDSRNGTQINGHKVRHSELLPGDEVRAGETVLIFRTSADGLSRSGEDR